MLLHTHWDMEANDEILWNCIGDIIVLTSFHVGGVVCACGKLALVDISTRSTTGPSFAGWTVLPRDFVGSRGCKIWALDFFRIALRLDGIMEAALPSCLSNFRATRLTCALDPVALGTPRDLAAGFLAVQLMGPLYYLLEYSAWFLFMPDIIFSSW